MVGLNGPLGYEQIAYGEDLQSVATGRRNPTTRPFVIGILPPDVPVNFVAIRKNVGVALKIPKNEAPAASSSPVAKKGVKKSAIDNINSLPDSFWQKFVAGAAANNMKPEDLATMLIMESGFDPSAMPPPPNVAKGLNQLIRSSAKVLGMTDAEFDNYDKLSAEDQLPWVFKYFQKQSGMVGGKWESVTQMYAANIGGGTAQNPSVKNAKNPNFVIYDGHMDKRVEKTKKNPNGVIQPGDPGYDAQIARDQRNFDGNVGLSANKQQILMSDLTRVLTGIQSGSAYQAAVARIKSAPTGAVQSSTPPEVVSGPGGVETAIIKGSDTLTDSEVDDPLKAIGRNISVDTDRQEAYVAKQVEELQQQILLAQRIPPLVMMINPASFGKNYEHNVEYSKGRRRPIVSMWHERPTVLSGKGRTAAQYVIKPSGEGGLSATNRIFSLSYENLMSLVYLYKNNGMTYTSGLGDESNRGVPLIAMSIYIYYDGKMYLGSFDNFSITDAAEKPYSLEYNFSFTCRYEIDVTSAGESFLGGV